MALATEPPATWLWAAPLPSARAERPFSSPELLRFEELTSPLLCRTFGGSRADSPVTDNHADELPAEQPAVQDLQQVRDRMRIALDQVHSDLERLEALLIFTALFEEKIGRQPPAKEKIKAHPAA